MGRQQQNHGAKAGCRKLFHPLQLCTPKTNKKIPTPAAPTTVLPTSPPRHPNAPLPKRRHTLRARDGRHHTAAPLGATDAPAHRRAPSTSATAALAHHRRASAAATAVDLPCSVHSSALHPPSHPPHHSLPLIPIPLLARVWVQDRRRRSTPSSGPSPGLLQALRHRRAHTKYAHRFSSLCCCVKPSAQTLNQAIYIWIRSNY